MTSFNSLSSLHEAISECWACDSVTHFPHAPLHEGTRRDILLIGESPAKNGWIVTGKAWRDNNGKIVPSGRVLQRLLDIIGLELLDIPFIEAAKCYPSDRKYLKTCTKNCKPFLLAHISLLKPKIIITLGDHPTRALLGDGHKNFSEVVGKMTTINIGGEDYTLLPIYHPSPASPLSYVGNVEIFERLKKLF